MQVGADWLLPALDRVKKNKETVINITIDHAIK